MLKTVSMNVLLIDTIVPQSTKEMEELPTAAKNLNRLQIVIVRQENKKQSMKSLERHCSFDCGTFFCILTAKTVYYKD